MDSSSDESSWISLEEMDNFWKKIERVVEPIFLKNQEKLDHSIWKDAVRAVNWFSLRLDLIHLFYPKIESFVRNRVSAIAQNLAQEKLLEKYYDAWRDYKVASENFQIIFSHCNNMILTKNLEISRNICDPKHKRPNYLTIEELTKSTWKNIILEQRGREITILVWNAIQKEEIEEAVAQEVFQSFEQVDAVDLLEETIFEKLGDHYKSKSIEWFQKMNVSEFIEKVMQKMEEEVVWCRKFLPKRSIDMMRSIFIEKATVERMDEMIKECQQMVMENRDDELKKITKWSRMQLLDVTMKSLVQAVVSLQWIKPAQTHEHFLLNLWFKRRLSIPADKSEEVKTNSIAL
ncbi:Hypothetical predicted protein [Cloeon dipterum]|uniref:Cullin N-terminal domain-containing protein n=1 Tax=Cloeon dipterum TaxID=197152 RepID=A0A8S1DPL4_9INSE|nr:Hypothetical predicted protein [Cloeon dipterum]